MVRNIFNDFTEASHSSPFSLKFKNEFASLEEEFTNEYLKRSVKYTRLSLILGFLFYSFFGVLDALIVPDQKHSLWLIRYAFVDPILIVLIVLSFIKSFRRYTETFGFIALIVAGSGISVMVAIADPPANYSYYSGLILVLMLGYGFVRIRFTWASLAGWLNVLIYEGIAIFITETPREILINNNFFFISANLIGMISCYAVEYYIRSNFIFARLLKTEQEKVKNLNRNLESMVNERTAELSNVNEALHKEIAARNISEEERESLEQQLFQAQKMESIGTLAGGIAHDFNNILSSLMGYTELSLRIVEDKSVLKSHLENMYRSEKRAAELVNQILYFARKSEKKNEPVIPKLILLEALKFIRSSIPSTIEIRQSIESNSLIMGNATQIHQVFMNLFTNSAHAMDKEGGILNVKMQDIELRAEESSHKNLKSGYYIRIEISDTGVGIPPDIINLVFEPYFTTKKVGEGTGLGLAVVHGIIEIYGGDIEIESIVGRGTTFIIYLPVTKSNIKQNVIIDKTIMRGNESLLLVDDEPLVAESVRIILSSLGYHVISMTSSLEALEEFKKDPEAFDLVITDMTMPHMNGESLAREIGTIRDDLSVIICSGYDKEFSVNKENYNGKRSYLNKPFSILEIASEVRRTLDLKS